jgi:hypothetical protein
MGGIEDGVGTFKEALVGEGTPPSRLPKPAPRFDIAETIGIWLAVGCGTEIGLNDIWEVKTPGNENPGIDNVGVGIEIGCKMDATKDKGAAVRMGTSAMMPFAPSRVPTAFVSPPTTVPRSPKLSNACPGPLVAPFNVHRCCCWL